jgi:hypothetical protein
MNASYVTFDFDPSRVLQAPGWKAQWHVGVRVTTSRKLVAFISGSPISLRVRQNTVGIIAFTSFRSRDLMSCDSTSLD